MDEDDPYVESIERAGHKLKRDAGGNIDLWVLDAEPHNGPGCTVCEDTWCIRCEDEIEPCIGEEGVRKEKEKWHEEAVAKAIALLQSEGYTVTK